MLYSDYLSDLIIKGKYAMASKITSIIDRLPRFCLSLSRMSMMAVGMSFFATASCNAHELWIEPQNTKIEAGEQVITDIIVGQNFIGNAQIYLPSRTELLAISQKNSTAELSPRPGSRPAIRFVPEQDGHLMIYFQSADEYVTYQNFDKFAAFITEKHAPELAALHRKRGLPDIDFKERYKRFAKSSMFIGAPIAPILDNDTQMALEFILLEIQPADDGQQQMRFKLTYQNDAVPNAPISLFIRDQNSDAEKQQMRTDNLGEVTITTHPAYAYLLDYVVIRELDPASDPAGAVWESLWASFSVASITSP